ncbi:hypothetical protein RTE98_00295 [Stutzerimonas frequens]|uniref:hypothetical protein n=1 Tax=Stutzerimonas frequens TaxID=2968969 RepID=UPI00293460AF|nr:hypothetical protein [Stutzerimonas frequens]WOC79003.1 hypothetical protein RTE98_00295 [Stutzerimonas frequens]
MNKFRVSPNIIRFIAIILINLIWVCLGYAHPFLILNENQALYIYSSQAQIIAAVFGLTITGYIFLHNQQERLAERDESTIDALDEIKKQQHSLITFLTIISLASIFLALLAIAYRESSDDWIKVSTQNSATAFFIATLLFTGYFVRDAMKPNKLEEVSENIKADLEERTATSNDAQDSKELGSMASAPSQNTPTTSIPDEVDEAPSESPEKGSLEGFLHYYNSIENSMSAFSLQYLESQKEITLDMYPSYEKSRKPRWSNRKIAMAMKSQGVISEQLAGELLELIRYRNALVHGRNFEVPLDILEKVKLAALALEHAVFRFSNY